jgi:hypothetical protein
MEAKEKAKELVDKFSNVALLDSYEAKQCALIAVDEIIENLVELSNGVFTFIHNVEYWQEVKREIEKL